MKKSTKRALAFAIAGALVATSVNVPSVQAAKKVKVSASKTTLYVGSTSKKKKATITVENAKKKITYKLTKAGKKIIKLNKTSGKTVTVTAKKVGEATVTVKVGKKVVKKITFTVKKYKKKQPTKKPTSKPTKKPSEAPSQKPTVAPSVQPTAAPSEAPTATPSATPTPTATPSATPTPTATPSATPTPGGSGGGGGSYVPSKPTPTPTATPNYKVVANGTEYEASEETFTVIKKAISSIVGYTSKIKDAYDKIAYQNPGTSYDLGSDLGVKFTGKTEVQPTDYGFTWEQANNGYKLTFDVKYKATKITGSYTVVILPTYANVEDGSYWVQVTKAGDSRTVSFNIKSYENIIYVENISAKKDGKPYLNDKFAGKHYRIYSSESKGVITVKVNETDDHYVQTTVATFEFKITDSQITISANGTDVDKLKDKIK